MAWITLALRKQELRAQINEYDMQLLTVSRQTRSIARHKMTDVSLFNIEKQRELKAAKDKFDQIRNNDKDPTSPEYAQWQEQYYQAREDYLAQKEEISDKYDTIIGDIEEEASEKQTDLEQEQTMIETALAAVRAEYESVSEQVNTEIKDSAVKFGS